MMAAGKTDHKPGRRPLRSLGLAKRLPWLLLVFGLLATHQFWKNAQQSVERDIQARFDFQVQECVSLIQQRMMAYEQVLRGVRGLFAASGEVTRHEFHEYAAVLRLDRNYPGIQGVGFSLLIPPGRKAAHTESIRNEGYPHYSIWPEGEREAYSSIIYLEPFTGRNLRAFGYDMYSEPVRRAAMARACDKRSAALSGKVRLVQENGGHQQAGVLIYLPVYANGRPSDTLEERRSSIVGWVYSPFRMDDLMTGLFGTRAAEIDIEIYDGSEISPKTLLYDSDRIRFAGVTKPPFNSLQHLTIAGQQWTLAFRSLPPLEKGLQSNQAGYVAYSGIILTLLLTLVAWLLAIGHKRSLVAGQELEQKQHQLEELNLSLEQRVAERTAELVRLNSELESFCYSISHEMRAPIARLEGFSAAIAESAASAGSEELVEYADRLGIASKRMRSVIDSLLMMYRLSCDQLCREDLDLSQLCRQITGGLMLLAGDRKVTVTIAPGVFGNGDRRMLEICLGHLLGNAFKYSSRRTESLIEFGVTMVAGERAFFVRDNGAGFDMAFAGKLFEPFCRLHNEMEFEGSGIGLPIVQRIIERHGGRIWSEAEEGKGATFFFTLGH